MADRTIIARGVIENNATHMSTGAGSIQFAGTINKSIIGNDNGVFGNITMNNAFGISLKSGATINGTIDFTNGSSIFIDDNLLTLGPLSTIIGSGGAGTMIYSNGVISDGGIRKVFPVASPASFTFPIGVAGKYTPAQFTLSYSSPGSITVKPINSKISSTTEQPNILNELQYYWNISGESTFTGLNNITQVYTYLDMDAPPPGDAGYVGAHYVQPLWTQPNPGVVNTVANTITFAAVSYLMGIIHAVYLQTLLLSYWCIIV